MRGQILGVDVRTGDGLLTGEDGRRYRFAPADWADRGEPARGLEVDFEARDDRALAIIPVPGARPPMLPPVPTRAAASDRNKWLAALLAFLLGPLGIHRFYLGRNGTGVLLLSVPWSWIDTIRYLLMGEDEFADRYSRR